MEIEVIRVDLLTVQSTSRDPKQESYTVRFVLLERGFGTTLGVGAFSSLSNKSTSEWRAGLCSEWIVKFLVTVHSNECGH
jgi:hypothetical protein